MQPHIPNVCWPELQSVLQMWLREHFINVLSGSTINSLPWLMKASIPESFSPKPAVRVDCSPWISRQRPHCGFSTSLPSPVKASWLLWMIFAYIWLYIAVSWWSSTGTPGCVHLCSGALPHTSAGRLQFVLHGYYLVLFKASSTIWTNLSASPFEKEWYGDMWFMVLLFIDSSLRPIVSF